MKRTETSDGTSTDARLIAEIATSLAGQLAGNRPEVAGGVLADLVARYLCGFANYQRAALLDLHTDTVRALVPVNEAILFEGKGHPDNRD